MLQSAVVYLDKTKKSFEQGIVNGYYEISDLCVFFLVLKIHF